MSDVLGRWSKNVALLATFFRGGKAVKSRIFNVSLIKGAQNELNLLSKNMAQRASEFAAKHFLPAALFELA